MKTNRPTLIKIGIVAAVLVAVVLYLRQQKESETEGYKKASKAARRAAKAAAARARRAAARAGKSAKKWR
jgi:predicted HicB family RNase H-like nuclease